ncbi:hypothetical protein ES702_06917 [subsurface metagenome]
MDKYTEPTKRPTKKPHKLFKGTFIRVAKKIHDIEHDGSLIYFEARVLGAIENFTWGWNKRSDHIAYSQIEKYSGLSHPSAVFGIHNLEAKRIIKVIRTKNPDGGNYPNVVKIQSDYQKWNLDAISNQYRDHLAKKRSRYQLSIANKRRLAEIENRRQLLSDPSIAVGGSNTKNKISSEISSHQPIPNGGGSNTKILGITLPIQGKKDKKEESRFLMENAPQEEAQSKPSSFPPTLEETLLLDLDSVFHNLKDCQAILSQYGRDICIFALYEARSNGHSHKEIPRLFNEYARQMSNPKSQEGQNLLEDYQEAVEIMAAGISKKKDTGLEKAREEAMREYYLCWR